MTEGEVRKFLSLKGQMLYMEEWESICFLGIPVMLDLHQMFKTGVSGKTAKSLQKKMGWCCGAQEKVLFRQFWPGFND